MKARNLSFVILSVGAVTPAMGDYALTTVGALSSTTGTSSAGALAFDPSGNLFGTTTHQGADSDGAVFEVAAGSGALTTVTPLSTGISLSGLISDGSGNLYGTTTFGQPFGQIIEKAANANAVTTVVSLSSTSGYSPVGEVTFGGSGDIYGTTRGGGASSYGTIFQFVPGTHALTARASFNSTTGYEPIGGLVSDASGNVYGTTTAGGVYGLGTVFELAAGSTAIKPLASFNGTNGANLGYGATVDPGGGVIVDTKGDLFGETFDGGTGFVSGNNSSGYGTVYEIVAGSNTITTLLDFSDAGYGKSSMIADSAGNLYCTAGNTVYEIAAGTNTVAPLYTFTGTFNGTNPLDPLNLIAGPDGSILGTTYLGGVNYVGTVFELSPRWLWVASGSESWSTNTNWDLSSTPNGQTRIVSFGNTIGTSAATVTLTSSETVGNLSFNNTLGGSYTIASSPGVALTIDDTGDFTGVNPTINVSGGNNTISAPIVLANGVSINLSGGSGLTIGDRITGAGPVGVSGAGTLTIATSGTLNAGSALSITAGAEVVLAPSGTPSTPVVQTVASLSVDAMSHLDIGDNEMIVTGTTPGAIRSQIIGGNIFSSLSDTAHGVGYIADGNGTEIRYALFGDTDLDGSVNFGDLLTLATNYGSTTATWAIGDFNYDGTVNFTDLLSLAANYGQSLTPGESSGLSRSFVADWNLAVSEAAAAVPEPGAIGLLVIGVMRGMSRRRRR